MNAQFTEAEVAEAVRGLGATLLKPRKAPKQQARVKQTLICRLTCPMLVQEDAQACVVPKPVPCW